MRRASVLTEQERRDHECRRQCPRGRGARGDVKMCDHGRIWEWRANTERWRQLSWRNPFQRRRYTIARKALLTEEES